jgi:hypothetical protein
LRPNEQAHRLTGLVLALAVVVTDSAGAVAEPINLASKAWDIRFSYAMPKHPDGEGSGWAFDFPKGTNCSVKQDCPGVHYVTTKYTKAITYGAKIIISGEIVTIGTPTFNYKLEKTNTCDSAAKARVLVQILDDDMYASNGRFWSNPLAIPLAPSKLTLTIPLDDQNWTNVDGERNQKGLKTLLNKMGNIGVTFGGGCFFGHGVNVSGGSARFIMTSFELKP